MPAHTRASIQSALAAFSQKPLRHASATHFFASLGYGSDLLPTTSQQPTTGEDPFELPTWLVRR